MNDIGSILCNIRKGKGLTRKDVAEKLKAMGIEISDKTLYGYESGRTTANADMFLALCKIYDINDIFTTFGYDGYNQDGSIILNMHEIDMVEKYRFISEHSPVGAKTVDYILNREHDVANLLKEEQFTYIAPEGKPNLRTLQYYRRIASAGTGQVVFEDMPTERIEIPDIPEYRCVSYAIGVNGDSMEPLYYDGDILLIETALQVEVGEIGIFIVDGEAFVKQLGEGKLVSLNDKYKDIPLTEYSNCMGRVVGKLEEQ